MVLVLAACQTHAISDDSQTLSQLQQDKARLNRVYAHTEAALLENQRSDNAYKNAQTKLTELKLKRFKACPTPNSPNTQARLQFAQCQYAATLVDFEQLQQWQRLKYQFPNR